PSGATPFSSGHLSQGSGTPSPSLSGSGQPLSVSPALRGQWSSGSITPSPSESTGQPSELSAGTRGHLSSASGRPSRSESGGAVAAPPSPRPNMAVTPSSTAGLWVCAPSSAAYFCVIVSRTSKRNATLSL